jgi:hypothetical protein
LAVEDVAPKTTRMARSWPCCSARDAVSLDCEVIEHAGRLVARIQLVKPESSLIPTALRSP